MTPPLDKEVHALELSLEGLLKLLGGNADQRERFYEIFKGITSVAEYRFAQATLIGAAAGIKSLTANLHETHTAAGEIQR
jgi:hypothetical protein